MANDVVQVLAVVAFTLLIVRGLSELETFDNPNGKFRDLNIARYF